MKNIKNKKYKKIDQVTQIYHYSNEGRVSRHEFAVEIFKMAKIDCKVNPITTRQYPTLARRALNTTMDLNKARIYFDIFDWKSSLNKCLEVIE